MSHGLAFGDVEGGERFCFLAYEPWAAVDKLVDTSSRCQETPTLWHIRVQMMAPIKGATGSPYAIENLHGAFSR